MLAHAVAATIQCIIVDLGWVPAEGTDAEYRIYQGSMGAGAGAVCDRDSPTLIATSAANAAAITVGPIRLDTGGSLCLLVAAANDAGESARVQFDGVSP